MTKRQERSSRKRMLGRNNKRHKSTTRAQKRQHIARVIAKHRSAGRGA